MHSAHVGDTEFLSLSDSIRYMSSNFVRHHCTQFKVHRVCKELVLVRLRNMSFNVRTGLKSPPKHPQTTLEECTRNKTKRNQFLTSGDPSMDPPAKQGLPSNLAMNARGIDI